MDSNEGISASPKLIWLYILPLGLLLGGIITGFLFDLLPLTRFLFAASIVFSAILTGLLTFKMYKHAPRRSEAYVTWGAFLTVHLGTYFTIIAALLHDIGKFMQRAEVE